MTRGEFYADVRRHHSPEWDFGVDWVKDGRDWPRYRVAWIVETGEVYAMAQGQYVVLGVVPMVGEYPYGAGLGEWSTFKDAQTIEQVMEGWTDERSLQWVKDRLVAAAAREPQVGDVPVSNINAALRFRAERPEGGRR